MPQWLRANGLLLVLMLIAGGVLWVAHIAMARSGLLANEQRYVMAGIGVLVIVVNYLVARRLVRRVVE